MALVCLYMSDRDPQKTLFTSKKEADAHDKKLELAEHICDYLQTKIKSIDEDVADEVGMLIAENKEQFLAALKGKPEALSVGNSDQSDQSDQKVTAIANNS